VTGTIEREVAGGPARPAPAVFFLGALAVIGLAATMILGLSLPNTREQREFSRLIAIHPPLAWCGYLAVGVSALASLLYLVPRTRSRFWDRVAASSAELAIVFVGLTLVTGSIWGRPTWGVWWTWDARLTVTALMLAVFVGYAAVRRSIFDHERRARVTALIALLGALSVPVNHMAVTWWRTLHQGRSLVDSDPSGNLDGSFIATMLLGFASMTLAYLWLLIQRYRLEEAEEMDQGRDLAAALRARRSEASQ
jgi:heme exporter protein C